MIRREEIIGDCRLILGDCREILPTLGKVDSVVTDPPYGIGLHYSEQFEDSEEYVQAIACKCVVPWAIENARTALVTTGNQCQHLYPRPTWTLAWVTPAGSGSGPWGFCCWQPILAYGKCPYLSSGRGRRHDFKIHTESAEKSAHPCPKPLEFMKWLVERASLVEETILDPFMGSGTTGVACANLGSKFIGIEIEPKYFDIACRRIEEAYKQPRLFEEPAPKPVQTNLLDEEVA